MVTTIKWPSFERRSTSFGGPRIIKLRLLILWETARFGIIDKRLLYYGNYN